MASVDAGDAGGLGGVEQTADHALEVRENTRRAFPGLGLHLDAPDELSRGAHEAASQFAPAQVNANGVAIGGHGRSRRGG